MWTRVLVLVLLAYCLRCIPAQLGREQERQRSIWENPIQFNTKAEDLCTMQVTGQEELTMLRISCRGRGRSYWCDYTGKPHTCRPYSNQPRHYFVQMSWGLRKLQNACQGPRVIKPHMCRKASDESQMVLSSSPFTLSRPETTRTRPVRPATVPVRPEQSRTEEPDSEEPGVRTTPSPEPTEDGTTPPAPTSTSKAERMARYYCWKSLQGFCAFFIGWFH